MSDGTSLNLTRGQPPRPVGRRSSPPTPDRPFVTRCNTSLTCQLSSQTAPKPLALPREHPPNPPTHPRLTTHLQEPSPRDVEISSSSYTPISIPELIKYPCRAFFGLTILATSPITPPTSKSIFLHKHQLYFTLPHQLISNLQPQEGRQILKYQYCLRAKHPQCRRNPSSSLRTQGHAPRPLNGYATTKLTPSTSSTLVGSPESGNNIKYKINLVPDKNANSHCKI